MKNARQLYETLLTHGIVVRDRSSAPDARTVYGLPLEQKNKTKNSSNIDVREIVLNRYFYYP
jgi:hypothetical protein